MNDKIIIDESSLVSGAGDETLKFWKVFPGIKEQKKNELLNIIDIR